MPMFNYHCSDCGADFELLVMGSTSPACPQCASSNIIKQISRVAAPGRSAALIARARAQAAKEGHLSNFSPTERKGR